LRAVSLIAVLFAARAATLAGREIPLSIWSPFAYLWQDILAGLVFFAVDARIRRPRLAWIAYALAAIYVAVNVPIARVLSTPLTWTMLRAARGPLSDAVVHYITMPNLVALAVPLAIAFIVPMAGAARRVRMGPGLVAAGGVVVAIGPYAASHLDTRGLDRNAFGVLVATALPRVNAAASSAEDVRVSPFGARDRDDLSQLRGAMRGRNVVLVILESTGARHLGLYGSSPDPMPRLAALARHAIVFERAYSVYPESIKGLFATLCSRYPAFDTAPEIYADVPCASLGAVLRGAGYRTALFHSGRFMYLGMSSIVERRGFDVLEDAGAIGGHVESSFGVDDDSTVRRALQWIDAADRRTPFFMVYLPTSGHSPYTTTTPGPFEATSDFWRYLNALHESDEALGGLLDGLQARQLDTNTLFVVFGDHGEAFGEHAGNFAHTMFINEENVRVPYVIAAPGALREQTRVGRIASVIDTAPTILDLLGIPPNAAHQGSSLLAPTPHMALFYTDYSLGWLGLADGCWKYLYEIDARRSRLYDVCADPAETRDRTETETARVAAYRTRVTGWAAAQKDLVASSR